MIERNIESGKYLYAFVCESLSFLAFFVSLCVLCVSLRCLVFVCVCVLYAFPCAFPFAYPCLCICVWCSASFCMPLWLCVCASLCISVSPCASLCLSLCVLECEAGWLAGWLAGRVSGNLCVCVRECICAPNNSLHACPARVHDPSNLHSFLEPLKGGLPHPCSPCRLVKKSSSAFRCRPAGYQQRDDH